MDLLRELQKARSEKGLSQSVLADRIGVPRLTITRLEAGSGSIQTLLAVMAALEFRISGVARGSTLPQQIRARRERFKLTRDDVASRTGLDPRTIEAVEQGRGTVRSLLALLNEIAPRAKKSDPPRASWAYDPRGLEERDKRFTPGWFLAHIVEAFGSIDLDPCAHPNSAVRACRRIILPENGLTASWHGHGLTYINPPFSGVAKWMARAADAWDNREVQKIVMLVPGRTDSPVFQQRISRNADVLFLAGRMRFESPEGLAWAAPFSLMVAVWGAADSEIERFQCLAPSVRMRPWETKNPRIGSEEAKGGLVVDVEA
jgi:transcriptional regulator with XRE-family HTH domain